MSTRKLVGHANFVRHNPFSDKIDLQDFAHLELYCTDATNCSNRFGWGLGMRLVAKSDLSTGNSTFASYVMNSKKFTLAFTAPYNYTEGTNPQIAAQLFPHYLTDRANDFIRKHGLAVRSIGVRATDATEAFNNSVKNGAVPVFEPKTYTDKLTNTSLTVAEVKWQDDVVLRFLSGNYTGPYLPNYELVDSPEYDLGIVRLDHAVTNVPKLFDTLDYIQAFTGFHEFGEFTAEDVGTVDSGLNSLVLANNNEMILLPVNEPTFGTKRKSQIQTYLEANNGAGIQHLALSTHDIFHTMEEMKKRTLIGGFDFMPAPSAEYYDRVESRIGKGVLTAEQLAKLKTLGLLADRDDQGVLLQVFTKPVGDRPTLFMEIIQRIGCDHDPAGNLKEQSAGCGGFGKGNFSELFKSIEDFEKNQEAQALKHLNASDHGDNAHKDKRSKL